MSNIREELSELMSNGSAASEDQPSPGPKGNQEISQAVQEAMDSAFERQEKQKQDAEYQKRLSQIQSQKQRENQAIQEATAPVIQAIQKEMEQDKSFAHLIEDNKDFPETVIQYCAESMEPEEAPSIIRELANNDDYRRQLNKADTELKMRRLINKIHRDILTGGSQGKIPEMLQKSIPQLNPNTSNSVSSDQTFYKDVARRHGLA